MNSVDGTTVAPSLLDDDVSSVRNISKGAGKRVIPKIKTKNAIPDTVLLNENLNNAISILPTNYNFEMHKVIWRILSDVSIRRVALQFPEGLLLYSCIISDIIQKFGNVRVIILGDVTYGACCVDDYTAAKLKTDLLIHYGHSCLVPITSTKIKVRNDIYCKLINILYRIKSFISICDSL